MNIPSHTELEKIMRLVRSIVFPEYYPNRDFSDQILRGLLYSQLSTVMCKSCEGANHECVGRTADAFVAALPELKRLLLTDVQAALYNDPAVSDAAEVILCYPFITAMLHHRTAHCLLQLGVPLLPRMLSEMAHSETGIDIHPAATIGEYFCIDHGTGVVIGATAVIGNHVMLYQGVTLGARNFTYDTTGMPLDLPRHPILEDHVTVYSNTSILGRVTIGHDTVIGGNVWLTHDVPPHSRILQQKAVQSPFFSNGEGI
ncbi:MAG: serine acetyltransferase [Paludibacteraceae bacterium]|nr:serine acetyltransferase [Paludibacteraceae bacterium]